MNNITLANIMDQIGETNLLELKRKLQFYKSQGYLFYPGTIFNKAWDEPIELYYVVTKGTINDCKAFPVPISFYNRRIKKREKKSLLPYIRSYYQSDNVVEDVLPLLEVYYGKHYIWFYLP
ncbi:hypothetical protein E2K98_02520 [Bacillus salipaludis]|uniref:Uncharacterized protein n=1 Tax=Bacillus salipaludis TaxID=2547811 RepID=A0A4R5W0N5_9BACI|nr:hypothetical protein [Bacillus salipaludis]MDQ6596387.1 hypothetical protein [Bacillus salipaludis]TDK65132.1 hypothetical protein E2K98_02520 [Bacillus salipaludis]